jgi:hypothetical protein
MNYEKQVNEILVNHGLDFTIEKWPLNAKDNKGKELITPYYGLFNSKTGACINTCKEGYTISQNAQIVEMVLRGMEPFGKKLTVSKAGSIHDGRKVFIQLAIEGDSKLNDGDKIKRHVTIIDSNDGTTSLSCGIGDITASCLNQFYKFYRAGQAKFRHTSTIEEKIKSIPALIQTALEVSLKQVQQYNLFQSTPVSRKLAHELVHAVLGHDRLSIEKEGKELTTRSLNIMDSLYEHIDKEVKQKGLNLWGLHSGVTSWTTHEKKGPKRTNGHAESMLLGTGYKKNMASMRFISKIAKVEMEPALELEEA